MRTVFMLLMTAVIGLLAWGSLAIITAHYEIYLPLFHPLITWLIWVSGPILLLIGALWSWSVARYWRRMEEISVAQIDDPRVALARGELAMPAQAPGVSGLEWLLGKLILLALIALPFWLGAAMPEVWAGAVFAMNILRRALLRS